MGEPVVFAQSVESLFLHGLKGRLPPATLEAVKAEGIDLSRPLLPAYPLAVWERALSHAGAGAFPGLSPERARFELGRHMLAGYDATVLGKAVVAMGRLVGPRRTLERMARNTRTANNYVDLTVEPLSDGRMRLTWTPVPELRAKVEAAGALAGSDFVSGLVTGVLEKLSVTGFSVEQLPVQPPAVGACLVRLPS
jgi:uncharacterized protein (TIGR02265 family)